MDDALVPATKNHEARVHHSLLENPVSPQAWSMEIFLGESGVSLPRRAQLAFRPASGYLTLLAYRSKPAVTRGVTPAIENR